LNPQNKATLFDKSIGQARVRWLVRAPQKYVLAAGGRKLGHIPLLVVFFQVVKASDWLAERIVWVSFPRLICV
jgi:hypothetical protein